MTYADLIGGKKIEVRLEKKPPIKPVAKHTVSGKPTVRSDARAKVTGEAMFTGDIRLPGMLYAAIVRPPAHGAKLRSADTSAAEKFPGLKVVRDGDLSPSSTKSPTSPLRPSLSSRPNSSPPRRSSTTAISSPI